MLMRAAAASRGRREQTNAHTYLLHTRNIKSRAHFDPLVFCELICLAASSQRRVPKHHFVSDSEGLRADAVSYLSACNAIFAAGD